MPLVTTTDLIYRKNFELYLLKNFMLKWFGVVLKEVMMIFVCGIHDCRDSGHTIAKLELRTERHSP